MEPEEKTIEQTTEEQSKKRVGINTPAAIITAGVLIALALFMPRGTPLTKPTTGQQPSTDQKNAPQVLSTKVTLRADDYVFGDPKTADVTIVEYSDSDCPFCERFHKTMKEVTALSSVKVAWVYRFFPLNIHPNAENEAIALECVGKLGGNTTFWKYLDNLIDVTVTPEKSDAYTVPTAVGLGINKAQFEACMKDPAVKEKIAQQSAEAQSFGARGTPYSIAIGKNGAQEVVPGAVPIEQLREIINRVAK